METDAHVLLWLLLEEGSEVEGVKALGLTTTKCLLVLFLPYEFSALRVDFQRQQKLGALLHALSL